MSVAISWADKMQLAKCDIMVGFPISSHIFAFAHVYYIVSYDLNWLSMHIGNYTINSIIFALILCVLATLSDLIRFSLIHCSKTGKKAYENLVSHIKEKYPIP